MKHEPVKILYEDAHIITCVKPHGTATQSRSVSAPDMVSIVKNHMAVQSKACREPYLAMIHRLDQPVKGILVFAKTPFAARELNKQLQNNSFGKYYMALVDGIPPNPEGTLENYLVKDSCSNISKICSPDTPNAKFARLHYKTLEKGQGFFNLGRGIFKNTPSPLEIVLETGRHHQIRVQLAGIGCPIIGDTKYNPQAQDDVGWQELQLYAWKLSFHHPKTHKLMTFQLNGGRGIS